MMLENKKKATSGKECGLKNLIIFVPLPYAGIIQVRYEGRPIWLGHLSENAPLAFVNGMLTLNRYLVNEPRGPVL